MPTITFHTEGHPSVSITFDAGDAGRTEQHIPESGSVVAQTASPDCPAPQATPTRSMRSTLRRNLPGVAAGLLGGVIIMGLRAPSLPDARAQSGYGIPTGQALLPPMPGGPVMGHAGTGAQSVNSTVLQAQQSAQQAYGAPYPGMAPDGKDTAPQANQGGAATASVAPTAKTAPTVGAKPDPAASPDKKPPFGLEP